MRAFRLCGECPRCDAEIVVRTRRADGARFVSCSAYPSCRWAGDYDNALAELAARYEQQAPRQRPRGDVDISRELRRVIAAVHPDRHRDNPLATEIAKLLNELRDRVS